MLKGDWLPGFAVVLILIFAVWVAFSLGNHEHESYRHYQSTGEQDEHAIDGGFLFEAPKPEPEPEREEWRDEQDLQAQRDMAEWAKWLLAISTIGVGVTGIGVWYVAKTLDATLSANAGFRESAERQLRAYVNIKDVVVLNLIKGEKPKLVVRYENGGQTPAYNLGCVSAFKIDMISDKWPILDFEAYVNSRVVMGSTVIFTSEKLAEAALPDIGLLQKGAAQFRAIGRVEYVDAFGKARFTDFKYFIDPENIGDGKRVSMSASADGNNAN